MSTGLSQLSRKLFKPSSPFWKKTGDGIKNSLPMNTRQTPYFAEPGKFRLRAVAQNYLKYSETGLNLQTTSYLFNSGSPWLSKASSVQDAGRGLHKGRLHLGSGREVQQATCVRGIPHFRNRASESGACAPAALAADAQAFLKPSLSQKILGRGGGPRPAACGPRGRPSGSLRVYESTILP